MNEMDAVRRLRHEVPVTMPVTSAETALLTAIRAEAAPVADIPGSRAAGITRHRLALAAVGALGLTLAAVVTAVATHGPAPGPRGSLAVRELAYRAAAAASRQPNVPAGQWVYWREQDGSGSKARVWDVWTTADGKKAAYLFHGKVHLIDVRSIKSGAQYIGQPEVTVIPPPYGGVMFGTLSGTMPVKYADVGKLPGDPQGLVDYLGHLPLPKLGPPPARAFTVIVELIQTYVMPPRLTAELFRALADIPGVTVDKHAVDIAGRHGVGFAFHVIPGDPSKQELVIDPHSYQLMGVQIVNAKGDPDSGTAILRKALVKSPGVLP